MAQLMDALPRKRIPHNLGAQRPQQTLCGSQREEVHVQVMHRVSGVQGADLQLLPQEGNESRCVLAHAYFLQG